MTNKDPLDLFQEYEVNQSQTSDPLDLFQEYNIGFQPKESLLKSTAKGFAKGGATFIPKAFWGGAKILQDVAEKYPAFTPWAAVTQLMPKDYSEKQLAEVEKTAEYLTPQERTGWTQYIPKAAETLGQMAGSALGTAGVGTLPAMAVGAGIDRTTRTQKEGESLPKSLLAGGMSGVAEYTTEKLPIKYLTQIGLPYLKRLAGGLISDVPGEVYETFIEMKSIDEGLLGKKYSPQEFAKAMLDTAATSAMTTGIATTAVQPFRQLPPSVPEYRIQEGQEVDLPLGEKPFVPQPRRALPPASNMVTPQGDVVLPEQRQKFELDRLIQERLRNPVISAYVPSNVGKQFPFEMRPPVEMRSPEPVPPPQRDWRADLITEKLRERIPDKFIPPTSGGNMPPPTGPIQPPQGFILDEKHREIAPAGEAPTAPAQIQPTEVIEKPSPVKPKEPWQMTRNEYEEYLNKYLNERPLAVPPVHSHKEHVEAAIKINKPVLPEVLKDYPELQPKTKEILQRTIPKEISKDEEYIKNMNQDELNARLENSIIKRDRIIRDINTPLSSGRTIKDIEIEEGRPSALTMLKQIYDKQIELFKKYQKPKEVITSEQTKGQGVSPVTREDIVSEPKATTLESGGFQSMYEAGEKMAKNTIEYVKAQREYKRVLKEGGIKEDVEPGINRFKQFLSFPHTIAKKYPKTKPIFDRTYQQVEQFENIIGDMKEKLDPYIDTHNRKIDEALIEADTRETKLTDVELRARGLSAEEIQGYKAFGDTMQTAAKILEQHLIKMGNNPQEVQAFIADFRETYIPRSRFGKFYVSVKDAEGNGITTPTFDTIGQARQAAVILKRNYPQANITMGNIKRLAPEAYEGMPLNVLAFLSQFDENLSANFASVIGKGFPLHLLRAEKIPGFEANLKKSASDYVLSLARYVSMAEYKKDIANMLDNEKSRLVDPKREADLWGYWKRYSDYIVKNPKEFAKFRQFFYYYYLGANVKSALINATQPLTTTYPVLTKYANQPEVLMGKAFRLAAMTQNKLMKVNPELAYAVQSAIHDGTISEQNINELRALRYGGGGGKIGNALSFLFSSAEKFNRKVSFIAMFLAGKEGYLKNEKIQNHIDLQKRAEDFVKETQYDYRKVDRPELARDWRAPFFTFRMFSGNYLSMLKNLVQEKEFGAFAKALGVMLILGGVSAIPGWKELEKALELMGYDPKKSFREYMGKEQGEIALHGLPFKTGANISGALGTIELLPGDIQQGVTAGVANLVLGVPTDLPKRLDRARQYLFKLHSPYRAIESVMPEFVRNPMVAIRWIREGAIRSPKYENLGQASKKDVFFKAIGIQPSNLTNIYERKHSEIILKDRATKNSEEYNFRLARAIYNGDKEDYMNIRNEIINHNQKITSLIDAIIPDNGSITKQITGMLNSNLKDIKESPKRARQEIAELQEIY